MILRENQRYSSEDIRFSNRTMQCDSREEPRISHLNFKNVIPSHTNYSIISTGKPFKLIFFNQAFFSFLLVLFFIIKSKKTNNYFTIKISLFNTSVTKYNGIKSITLSFKHMRFSCWQDIWNNIIPINMNTKLNKNVTLTGSIIGQLHRQIHITFKSLHNLILSFSSIAF